MAKKHAPIQVIVHYPQSDAGKQDLAQRVAGVHADMIGQYIRHLDCPAAQKSKLLDAVIADAAQALAHTSPRNHTYDTHDR